MYEIGFKSARFSGKPRCRAWFDGGEIGKYVSDDPAVGDVI